MEHKTEKKLNKILIIFIAILCIVLLMQTIIIIQLVKTSSNQNTKNDDIITNSDEETIESEYLTIETPYANLIFLKKWENYLYIEQIDETPYEVRFYCDLPNKEPLILFTYTFGAQSDILIGHLNNVEIGLSIGTDVADDTWSEEEKSIFYSMREESGVVIEGLETLDGFQLN